MKMMRKWNYNKAVDRFDQEIKKMLATVEFRPAARVYDTKGFDYDGEYQLEGASKRFYRMDAILKVPYENLFEAIAAEKEGKRFAHSIDYRTTLFVPVDIPNFYWADFESASRMQCDQLMSGLEQMAVSTWNSWLDNQQYEHKFGFGEKGLHVITRLPHTDVAPSEVVKKSIKYVPSIIDKAKEIKNTLKDKYTRAAADFKQAITALPLRIQERD